MWYHPYKKIQFQQQKGVKWAVKSRQHLLYELLSAVPEQYNRADGLPYQ